MTENNFDNSKLEELREKLNKSTEWPTVYFFKFIVPNNNANLAEVFSLFDDSSVISTKESSGGKFISVSAKELVLSADVVIEKYILASKIKGIISL